MPRPRRVLGAGGAAATAWEIRVITGLADEGIDVRAADLFVGVRWIDRQRPDHD